jgi:hypothetical protein
MLLPSKFLTKKDVTVYEYYRTIATQLVTLYDELEQAVGKQSAQKIMSDWAEKKSIRDMDTTIKNLGYAIDSFDDVKRLLREWVHELDEQNETVEVTDETADHFLCSASECIHARVFNDLGYPELGYILHCKQDYASTPHIHPSVGFRRTKTLMQGDECCDFDYSWTT